MSAEKIIDQIKKDSEKEIKKIKKDVDTQVKIIIDEAKKEAEQKSKEILEQGKKQADNIKKILISQSNQDSNRQKMNAREEVIDKCFNKAKEKLSKTSGNDYEKILDNLIKKGKTNIKGEIKVYTSRSSDKKIAEKHGLKVVGNVESIGGIILASNDGKITLDNTFEGILKREKDEIRNKVGKVLFS